MSASIEQIWNFLASRPKFVFPRTFIFWSLICPKIEFSKAFDGSEAVSLSDSIVSEKSPLKPEVELQEEITCKFSKGGDEAGIPETKPVTFNQCTFIISKEWKLNWKETFIFFLYRL